MTTARRNGLTCIAADLTVRERDAVEAMKARTGIAHDANLIRVALYRFAAHLDLHVDTALFDVRGPHDRRAATVQKARSA